MTLKWVLVLMLLFSTAPAVAQTRAELAERLEDLEKKMRAVQRQIFDSRGDLLAVPGSQAPTAAASGGSPLLADLSVRLDSLERQLRELTGQIEELQFAATQNEQALNLLREEHAFRLERLEKGLPIGDLADADDAEAEDGEVVEGGLIPIETPQEAAALNDQLDSGGPVVLPPDAAPEEAYRFAFEFVRSGNLAKGQTALELFLERYSDDTLAVNAQFWLGKTLMQQGEYASAGKQFLGIYQEHGDHEKAAESLIELGLALKALGDDQGACEAIAVFRSDYPDADGVLTKKADKAEQSASCS